MLTTFRRKKRSSRKRPRCIWSIRFLFVAEMMRTSVFTVSFEPRRSNSFSWMTRSTLPCVNRLMSAISSRKIVPPFAPSNLPIRVRSAPVNDPFSWPKSSLSRSCSGSAAQLTRTNGPPARELL